jgi:5,10-methylenetetrahydromethanopterin reductase
LDAVPGFTNLWVFDERFHRDPWVTLGLLAASTERVTLGTCVTDPFIRHPALTGTAIATLFEASGGRAVLGFGAGVSGFRALGIERRAPATRLREAVELVRRLWASPTEFDFEGQSVTFEAARLSFGPIEAVPIMIAGRGPRILSLAGELADQVLVATFTDGPLLDHALARLEEGVERRPANLGALLRGAWIYVCVDDDREAARRAVREGIAVALWGSRPILDALGIELPRDLVELMDSRPYAHTPEVIKRAAALVPEELIDVCSVAGTAAECTRQLERLASRGFEHFAIWPFPPEGGSVDSVVDRLIADVIPSVRTFSEANQRRIS